DPLSAYFALRTLELKSGDKLTLDILDGTALWRSTVVISRGKVHLDEEGPNRRTLPAILIEGTSVRIDDAGQPTKVPPRKVKVWFSDDPLRLLLRMEADTAIGTASLELTGYQQGRLAASAPAPKLPGITVA